MELKGSNHFVQVEIQISRDFLPLQLWKYPRLNSTPWNYRYKIIFQQEILYVTVGGCCIKSVATLFSQKLPYYESLEFQFFKYQTHVIFNKSLDHCEKFFSRFLASLIKISRYSKRYNQSRRERKQFLHPSF